MKKRILFVDDERNILKNLRKMFEKTDFQTFFAESGSEALDILKKEKVDLIVSDIKMPNMDGFELLQEVKKSYPLILRVALSGFSENKKIFEAIDSNLIKIYLLKPWDADELLVAIEKLFALEAEFHDKKLLKLISELNELPTVPTLYTNLSNMVERDANVEDISKLIEEDQSIASRILKVANSAFYAAKTGSIQLAIMYIGLTNVKNIVLTNGVFSKFMVDKANMDSAWKHVNLTNKLMNDIYKICLDKNIPSAFASAGLLHDIGKVVVMNHLDEEYHQMFSAIEDGNHGTLNDEESRILGVDHQKIGGYLLNWWGLPLPIVEASLYHHDPLNSNIINIELVGVVHISNYYSWKILGNEVNGIKLMEEVFESLDIDKAIVERIVENYDKDTIEDY